MSGQSDTENPGTASTPAYDTSRMYMKSAEPETCEAGPEWSNPVRKCLNLIY